jgi:glycerol kinase
MEGKFIFSVDQGTSSSRAILFRVEDLSKVVSHSVSIETRTPHSGWAEQDPLELFDSVRVCLKECTKKALEIGIKKEQFIALGITNQRETTIAWDGESGEPLGPALVWFDVRTQGIVRNYINQAGSDRALQEKTGLLLSTYFCAPKMRWMVDNYEKIKELCKSESSMSRLRFGTVESWLLFCLDKKRPHTTDISNASRTLLFNLNSLHWDNDLLDFFGIKREWLPTVKPNAESFGSISDPTLKELHGLPITGMIGDQQSALLGHGCLEAGQIKITYGTGIFMLKNIGKKKDVSTLVSNHGLLSTIAFQLSSNTEPLYALEGSIAMGGKFLDWLRRLLNIDSPSEIDNLASNIQDPDPIIVLPTLTGAFAPHWETQVKGSIQGLSLQSERAHVCRAALEAICFQVQQIMELMQEHGIDKNLAISVDGGVTKSTFCMQIQADLSQTTILRYSMTEFTAIGALIAAGIGVGLWKSIDDVPFDIALNRGKSIISPSSQSDQDGKLHARYIKWKAALEHEVDQLRDQN